MSKKKRKRNAVSPANRDGQSQGSTVEKLVAKTNIHQEMHYICDLAMRGESRVVGLDALVFFSTCSRDAWVLDWRDDLALCLVKSGVAQPVEFGHTDRYFAIRWEGHFEIEGGAFTYIDDSSPDHSAVIEGYPVNAIQNTIERLRQHAGSS